jgi:hypothetical protein
MIRENFVEFIPEDAIYKIKHYIELGEPELDIIWGKYISSVGNRKFYWGMNRIDD